MTRELVYTGFISLDGVADSPGGTVEGHRSGGWVARHDFLPEAFSLKGEELGETTALLFGRRSYEAFGAVWPQSEDHAAYRDLPKYVVSTTIGEGDLIDGWGGTTILRSAEDVAALKETDGGSIFIHGSCELARNLADAGLIDRYNLLVFPYLLGAGKSIFGREDRDATALRLRESQTYPNGVLKVIYDVMHQHGSDHPPLTELAPDASVRTVGGMSDLALPFSVSGQQWLIHKPLEIGIYVVLAVVLRWVLHRAIDRLVRGGSGRDADSAPRRFGLDRLRGRLGSSRLPAVRRRTVDDPAKAQRDREARARRAQRAETIGSVLKSAVSFLVLIWVVIQSLAILGVNVAPLIASAGVVGVALGFGAQNLVRDFISGVFMLIEDQYGVGDVVDLGEVTGTVETVGMRITTVRDVQGTLWYVRNGEIMRVANFSQDYAVAFLQLPISYSADVDLACRVALEAALEAVADEPLSDDVLGAPDMLGVDGATADRVSIRLTVRVRANRQWAVERELRRRILRAFDEHDIAPPYRSGLPVAAGVQD